MADLTIQEAARAANDLVWAAATATTGDTWINSGKEALLVNNASGAPINVTITTPATADGDLAIADRVISVGAGKIALLGPFSKATYNDPDDATVQAVCSAVTSVTLAVIII